MRLGIDVGGTFTDVVMIDDATGSIYYTKTLTTPSDLAMGVLTGIEKILHHVGTDMENVEYISHGTTIGTNTLIERKGAKVGLITTKGFRDVLEIARIERPDEGLYDMMVDLPDPLVPRYLRVEVDERIGADGNIVQPLDVPSVIRAGELFKAVGVEAIAVCLLFSFCNPEHESEVRKILQEVYPGVPISLSSEIAPEFREYERTSTTVINAYLAPVTERYLESLSLHITQKYGHVDLRIMQASGGVMTVNMAKSHSVNMVNSGPAGGALAAALIGKISGVDKLISVDMGGTSFDVGLIVDGHPRVKPEGEFEGYPVKIPLIDVEGIGAGGGSIAWVDAGGALNVGPQSAAAFPGPACYGQGGLLPTVTDANLVLGRINARFFLGGEMVLYPDRSREAIAEYVAKPLRISIEEAASGIIRVVNANMIRGISVGTTQKGYDVREFSLLAFGGAGPLHAVELAQELEIKQVIIPPMCAVFSAFGTVASDLRYDYVKSVALSEHEVSPDRLEVLFSELEAQARCQLQEEHIPQGSTVMIRAADLRYEGQSYELTIPLNQNGITTKLDLKQLIADFHNLHMRIFEYADPSEPIEVISLRLAAICKTPKITIQRKQSESLQELQVKHERMVYFPATGFVSARIYNRDTLQPGHLLNGPCLIEETASTTVIPMGWLGRVDNYGNICIVRGKEVML